MLFGILKTGLLSADIDFLVRHASASRCHHLWLVLQGHRSSFVSVFVFNQLRINCHTIDRDNTTPVVDRVNLVCSFILGLSCYPANIYVVYQSSLFNIIGFPEIDVMRIELRLLVDVQ